MSCCSNANIAEVNTEKYASITNKVQAGDSGACNPLRHLTNVKIDLNLVH